MRYIFSLLLLLSIVSCKKDTNGNDVPLFVNTIKAGNKGGMLYDTLNPNISVTLNWDAQNLYAYGSDSIDMNADGNYDFIFECSLLNPDSLHLLNGQMPNPFPNFSITPKNGYLVSLKKEVVYVGLGQTTDVYWVDSLNYDDKIRESNIWGAGKVKFWGENPGGALFTNGPWYAVNKTMYMGYKYMDKLGWIEVDATNKDSLIFKSKAIQF